MPFFNKKEKNKDGERKLSVKDRFEFKDVLGTSVLLSQFVH